MINMPYGGGSQFNALDLIAHIRASGRGYIVIGKCNCTLAAHKKPHSLDFWLRHQTPREDTRQACQVLIDDLVATGLFAEERGLKCPDSGYTCRGVLLA